MLYAIYYIIYVIYYILYHYILYTTYYILHDYIACASSAEAWCPSPNMYYIIYIDNTI